MADPHPPAPPTPAGGAEPRRSPLPLVEGRDYTVESGRWVFTAHYHLARGYCCQNGCRHCPYGYPKDGSG